MERNPMKVVNAGKSMAVQPLRLKMNWPAETKFNLDLMKRQV